MSADDPIIDLNNLRRWIGLERHLEDMLNPFPAQALAATLDRDDVMESGQALPPAWHWLYFLETPHTSAVGPDGHPKLGGFLPPIPLTRRMWAAGHFDVVSPITLGQRAARKTSIRSVEAKNGKTGALLFVTLDHELSQEGHVRIREQQDLVYRPILRAPAGSPPGVAAPTNDQFRRQIHPDPVLLFRYSALTFNGHRIHYDRPYATQREFYPALVVHAPLLATLLLDLLQRSIPGARLTSFRFRALRPAFDNAPLQLCGRHEADTVNLWTADSEGQLGMSATAVLG